MHNQSKPIQQGESRSDVPAANVPGTAGPGAACLARLDVTVNDVLRQLMQSESWKALVLDEDVDLTKAVLREIYREVLWFFSPVIESGLAMSGKLAWVDTGLMKELAEHLAEETLHRKTAMDGYLALGGTVEAVEQTQMSPTAFAVASVWRGLERMASPLTYVGAMFFAEALNPRICEPLGKRLKAAEVSATGAHHIHLHASVDVEHGELFRRWIVRLVGRDPGAEQHILYGMQCVRAVYPLPMFAAALSRARQVCEHPTAPELL